MEIGVGLPKLRQIVKPRLKLIRGLRALVGCRRARLASRRCCLANRHHFDRHELHRAVRSGRARGRREDEQKEREPMQHERGDETQSVGKTPFPARAVGGGSEGLFAGWAF